MDQHESLLHMVQWQVDRWTARVARQTVLIAELSSQGLETGQAKAFLHLMLKRLGRAYEDLNRERVRAGLSKRP